MTEAELYTMYKGIYLLKEIHTPQTLKYFEEFSFRPDDIIIAAYPKSGTHLNCFPNVCVLQDLGIAFHMNYNVCLFFKIHVLM